MKLILKTLLLVFLFVCLTPSTGISQKTNYWKGGNVADPANWYNPFNWSLNTIPDFYHIVVIKNTDSKGKHYPIIKNERQVEISFLELENDVSLLIELTAQLKINGATTYNYGIIGDGRIINYGEVIIQNTALKPIEGKVAIDNYGQFLIFRSGEKPDSLAQLINWWQFFKY